MNTRSECPDRSAFALRFAQVQDDLRQDPYRIGLAGVAFESSLVAASLPFPQEFWILHQDGRDIGRIAANCSAVLNEVGYIGFFEAAHSEAAQLLLETAREWLKVKGVKKVYGPINFNTWLPYRFRIHHDDSPSFAFEPNNPPEYPIWFQNCGLQIAATYHSDGIDGNDGMIDVTRGDYEAALAAGYTFRIADHGADLDSELHKIYDMNLQTFGDNFLFEPVPFEVFRQFYVPSVLKTEAHTVHFVCDPSGKEVGYFSTFMENAQLILKTLAVAPEGRGHRLSNALLHVAVLSGKERGARNPIPALIRDGIQSESYSKKQSVVWKHHYALFTQELS
jgi:hypothetical protein